MARAYLPHPTLLEEINKFIPSELGMRREACEKLRELGINPETNIAITKHGSYATVFLVPQKNIVIKFFGKESESNVKFPNDSPYMLQPFCHSEICGNQLAIFPLLETDGVTDAHAEQLRVALDAAGYFFSDRKLENIGLTVGGIPYVIDNDAVTKDAETKIKDLAVPESRRKIQWNYINPEFSLDHHSTVVKRWEIDPEVRRKMAVPDGSFTLLDAKNLVDLRGKKESEPSAKL